VVANGKGLIITHSGLTSLPTSSSPLQLNNVLYIIDISQNLLSISQLCQNNFVSIEFFSWHFLVKDLSTGWSYYEEKRKTMCIRFHAYLPVVNPIISIVTPPSPSGTTA